MLWINWLVIILNRTHTLICKILVNEVVTKEELIEPNEATFEDLRVVHTQSYLKSLNSGCVVARCVEIPIVAFLPSCLINRYLLKPMRHVCF
jgi:histone deacetylase 11